MLTSTLTSAVEVEASFAKVILLLVDVLVNELRGQRVLSDENQTRKSENAKNPPD